MKGRDLIEEIVRVAEKAALLARTIRAEEALFKLLVQEKTGDEKNKRFLQDFKTLADVLVQQTVQNDLGKKFPSMASHIFGEESNKFTNVLGETVTIEIKPTVQETAELLGLVLDGNAEAAKILAEVVHQNVAVDTDLSSCDLDTDITDGTIGIWIDPIDSTAQYIHGDESIQHDCGVYTRGLQSVLVLIGAYDLNSGAPVAGVVNQPFAFKQADDTWQGRTFWGLHYRGVSCHSPIGPSRPDTSTQHLVVSASETRDVCDTLRPHATLVTASGGGYKLLCVIEHLVNGFVLSRGSCFKWDTCGPHAILLSLGGGTLDLKRALRAYHDGRGQSPEALKERLQDCSLKYEKPDEIGLTGGQVWSNTGGLLAYLNVDTAVRLLEILDASLHAE